MPVFEASLQCAVVWLRFCSVLFTFIAVAFALGFYETCEVYVLFLKFDFSFCFLGSGRFREVQGRN